MAPRPKKRPAGPRRLSSEERAARNREIARRRLEGGSVADVAEEFGVSRSTVKRAARDRVGALRREEEARELTAIRD
jgi:DNA-directed RNA polymerase specialized sigma24 family protein